MEQISFAADFSSAADELSDIKSCDLSECAADKNALERLYLKYRSAVYAFSLGLYGSPTIAEDCVSETFIRLPQAAGSFKKGCSESAFILGVAKNVSRELYRSEMRFRSGAVRMERELPLENGSELSGALEAVRRLAKKYRVVLILKVYNRMTFKEIAAFLKIPESTAKSRYQKAIRLAARQLRLDLQNEQERRQTQ